MASKKTFQFEDSLSKLERLVEQMEDGDFSLEESLQAFEEGIKLTRECQQALKKAEQKVQMLIQKNGELDSVPFAAEDLENE
ncbi:MAG: exodeoxyribonuclease VII small subunit [Gammaproteobacteria bacterium]|nr:exodeoxyribonuclease VII small subunit [Gammaproteobacteria bacterium]